MEDLNVNWEPLLEALNDLYEELDQQVSRLYTVHSTRLRCGQGCNSCCVDGITLFEVEAENIRRRHTELLTLEAPYPEGACAFLDEAGACRIYPHRPYVCRTQGLPLRWVKECADGTSVETRDICPFNENGPPIESLPAGRCGTTGPFDESLQRL